MIDALRLVQNALNPVRARAKVLARASREMRAELVRIRREAGFSQQDIADRLGITQQAVYKLERYDADPRLSTLERYANAVGALIEHRVYVDRGQSVRLANDSGWDSAPIRRHQSIRYGSRRRSTSLDGWAEAAPVARKAS